MQRTENQLLTELEAEFELLWCSKLQVLVHIRRSKMTQTTMAAIAGRSLKTIQRFEKYNCKDPALLYIYRKILADQ